MMPSPEAAAARASFGLPSIGSGAGGRNGGASRRTPRIEARYDARVPLFSRRLPHVLTRGDLALLLAPTYAQALSVDEEEALERLRRALERPQVAEDLYRGISAALVATQGARTSEDALVDRLSAGVQARRSRAKPAPATPALSAVLVRLNLEIGLAPEPMRATLAAGKGQALLEEGLRQLGAHLVKDLLKG
jgi:hypothetical protein